MDWVAKKAAGMAWDYAKNAMWDFFIETPLDAIRHTPEMVKLYWTDALEDAVEAYLPEYMIREFHDARTLLTVFRDSGGARNIATGVTELSEFGEKMIAKPYTDAAVEAAQKTMADTVNMIKEHGGAEAMFADRWGPGTAGQTMRGTAGRALEDIEDLGMKNMPFNVDEEIELMEWGPDFRPGWKLIKQSDVRSLSKDLQADGMGRKAALKAARQQLEDKLPSNLADVEGFKTVPEALPKKLSKIPFEEGSMSDFPGDGGSFLERQSVEMTTFIEDVAPGMPVDQVISGSGITPFEMQVFDDIQNEVPEVIELLEMRTVTLPVSIERVAIGPVAKPGMIQLQSFAPGGARQPVLEPPEPVVQPGQVRQPVVEAPDPYIAPVKSGPGAGAWPSASETGVQSFGPDENAGAKSNFGEEPIFFEKGNLPPYQSVSQQWATGVDDIGDLSARLLPDAMQMLDIPEWVLVDFELGSNVRALVAGLSGGLEAGVTRGMTFLGQWLIDKADEHYEKYKMPDAADIMDLEARGIHGYACYFSDWFYHDNPTHQALGRFAEDTPGQQEVFRATWGDPLIWFPVRVTNSSTDDVFYMVDRIDFEGVVSRTQCFQKGLVKIKGDAKRILT